jgi:hypothetical protein
MGLKVVDKYDNGNEDWLAMNGNRNEWAVAFHGIGSPAFVIPKVMIEGMRKGPRQLCESDIDPRTSQPCGVGIYCTPNIETAEAYANDQLSCNGKYYSVIF